MRRYALVLQTGFRGHGNDLSSLAPVDRLFPLALTLCPGGSLRTFWKRQFCALLIFTLCVFIFSLPASIAELSSSWSGSLPGIDNDQKHNSFSFRSHLCAGSHSPETQKLPRFTCPSSSSISKGQRWSSPATNSCPNRFRLNVSHLRLI